MTLPPSYNLTGDTAQPLYQLGAGRRRRGFSRQPSTIHAIEKRGGLWVGSYRSARSSGVGSTYATKSSTSWCSARWKALW